MKFTVESKGLDTITPKLLTELNRLYSGSYHNTHMYKDLRDDIAAKPAVFRLFLARLDDSSKKLIGARVIESKAHSFIDYHGYSAVHGKRFCVDRNYRGQGVGKALVDAGKQYCFVELGLSAVFGESNELGALSMYGREGAMYFLDSIRDYSMRNSPEENIKFFREFITNPVFRSFRLPTGSGIQFVYCKDDQTAQRFRTLGYISKDELLQLA